MINGLLSLWTWVEIALVALVGFLLQLVAALVTLPFDRRRRVVGRIIHSAGVVATRLSPFFDFAVHGQPPPSLARRTVIVSNHESHADPFLLAHLPWQMRFLAKASLFKIPLIGWGLWVAGDISVKRGTADSVQEAMRECAWWLEQGMPVMIFPEGTRSRTGELLPFKDGAFRLAIESQADLLPVAVRGTREAMPNHTWRFGFSKARVMVGTPIATKGMTLADVERLKLLARGQIEALRGQLSSPPAPSPALRRVA